MCLNSGQTPDAQKSAFQDEHGQSMIHFAAARTHGRNALFQLLLETEINVAYRDELYRTARDISIQANIPENTSEIDRYVLHIATKGTGTFFKYFMCITQITTSLLSI